MGYTKAFTVCRWNERKEFAGRRGHEPLSNCCMFLLIYLFFDRGVEISMKNRGAIGPSSKAERNANKGTILRAIECL